jgi:hypothetical protein
VDGSGSCPVVGFGISRIEPSGSTAVVSSFPVEDDCLLGCCAV